LHANRAKLRTPSRLGHPLAHLVRFIFTDNGRDALATGKAPAWVKNELTLRALHEKHADTDYKKGRKRGA